MIKGGIRIGTCSWKYDSWRGLVYPVEGKINHLKEYAKTYSTVEIDQWFWSLFGENRPRLPDAAMVREYGESVPDDFKFTVKIPNSITLTHHYHRDKKAPLINNPYFLSVPLLEKFLETIHLIKDKIGVLIFQFEYLNRKKMPSQSEFQDQFSDFMTRCPREYHFAIEIRNPNYLNREYFKFLERNDLAMVFMQGYYLPPIFDIYRENRDLFRNLAVIRLMGRDRNRIEAKTKKKWDRIVEPRDQELEHISIMIKDLLEKKIELYVNINNHYEGSAPRTIQRIIRLLDSES